MPQRSAAPIVTVSRLTCGPGTRSEGWLAVRTHDHSSGLYQRAPHDRVPPPRGLERRLFHRRRDGFGGCARRRNYAGAPATLASESKDDEIPTSAGDAVVKSCDRSWGVQPASLFLRNQMSSTGAPLSTIMAARTPSDGDPGGQMTSCPSRAASRSSTSKAT
jgi:hypothetical protein